MDTRQKFCNLAWNEYPEHPFRARSKLTRRSLYPGGPRGRGPPEDLAQCTSYFPSGKVFLIVQTIVER